MAARAVGERSVPLLGRLDVPGLSVWLMSFPLVFYMAAESGGHDPVVRGEVGVAEANAAGKPVVALRGGGGRA